MNSTFHIFSILLIVSGFFCALIIAISIFSRHRQPMKIMEAVWPLTGLWASWAGLWAYFRMGMTTAKEKGGQMKMQDMAGMDMQSPGIQNMDMPGMDMQGMDMNDRVAAGTDELHINPAKGLNAATATGDMPMKGMGNMGMPARPMWQTVALSTLHCGAGCTLADIIGEWFTFFVPVSIGSSLIAGQWVLDYILALVIGIFFQYAAIRPMEKLTAGATIVKAFKIDFFSLTSWQIGMYGWMAIVIFGLHHGSPLPRNSWEFWFMMQIAMFFGFFTSYPTNWLLIRLGIKKGM